MPVEGVLVLLGVGFFAGWVVGRIQTTEKGPIVGYNPKPPGVKKPPQPPVPPPPRDRIG